MDYITKRVDALDGGFEENAIIDPTKSYRHPLCFYLCNVVDKSQLLQISQTGQELGWRYQTCQEHSHEPLSNSCTFHFFFGREESVWFMLSTLIESAFFSCILVFAHLLWWYCMCPVVELPCRQGWKNEFLARLNNTECVALLVWNSTSSVFSCLCVTSGVPVHVCVCVRTFDHHLWFHRGCHWWSRLEIHVRPIFKLLKNPCQ